MENFRLLRFIADGWPKATDVTVVAILTLAVLACTSQEAEQPASVTTDSGLIITTTQAGSGAAAAPGDNVSVHYTGWLHAPETEGRRGAKFDSSVDRGQPFQFPLGAGRVIAGWDEGVAGMLVGEKRELIIPPELAYGSRGAGGVIPPDAILLFEVELLGLE